MFEIEESNKQNVNDIIYAVKLASLLFCILIIYNHFNLNYNYFSSSSTEYFKLSTVGLFCLCIIFIYLLWSFSSALFIKYKNKNYIYRIENYIFIAMFSLLIILSGTYIYQYKFLYIFIIISSTLQSGKKHGMIIATISSAVTLIIDLVTFRGTNLNIYFENDLIMAGVFMLTAWPLGHYVQIEEDNMLRKNKQLDKLNNELADQNYRSKLIEDNLLKNEVCCRMIIENSKDVILVHDENKLIFANSSAIKLLGYSIEELTDKSIYDLICDNQKEAAKNTFKEEINEQKPIVKFEGNLKAKNDDIFTVEYISNYFLYECKPAILSIVHDISSEKKVEQLTQDVKNKVEQLNETKEFNDSIIELFANISHELKTPLNVIFSAVQVLEIYKNDAAKFEDKIDKYVLLIRQNCYRLMRLINNFLDITKVDSGFLKLHMRNYDIVKVVEDITLSVASYAESKKLELIFDTDVEEKVMGFDADKIERIMLNLLSNAVKYTNPDGKITVTMHDGIDNVCISVKDTGLGIPADKENLIFERFGQVDKTLKRVSEGSGIGLSLVKSFVEMHNGTIELKSELGKGSEFIVTLPAVLLDYHYDETKGLCDIDAERINIEFSDIYTDV